MGTEFTVTWEGELPAAPAEVWDAFTRRTAGWLWEISYEPRAGGAERGLTGGGGTVTVWEPHRRFTTRAEAGDGDFNQLDYALEDRGESTYLRFTHSGVFAADPDLQLDACRRHTAFYYHSLGEYLRHFRGRDAAYVSVQAPEASARDGFATMRRALGVNAGVAVGDRVRLDPAGAEGVVDYATSEFLGVRGADALYRFYGRDRWHWPFAVAVHRFGGGADEAGRAWSAWLDGVFPTEAEA
jgi:Activator of Hsp90 ATPase homolog 1-like protein